MKSIKKYLQNLLKNEIIIGEAEIPNIEREKSVTEILKNPPKLSLGPYAQHTFCSYCGNAFKQDFFPKQCDYCYKTTYRPYAVAVAGVIPVRIKNECGILLARRAEEPQKGGLHMCGGHLEFGEVWNEALSRETQEEINLKVDPKEWNMSAVKTAKNGNIVIFATTSIKEFDNLDFFQPNNEVSELKVGTDFMDLCFETHTEVYNFYLKTFFKNRI
jgi:8-oxo-dGTP pyrophosphatase MutT (NUDIX family)